MSAMIENWHLNEVSQSVTHSVVTRPAKLKVLSPAWHTIISLIPSRLSRWVNDSVFLSAIQSTKSAVIDHDATNIYAGKQSRSIAKLHK